MTTNRTYDELKVGDVASLVRVVTAHDLVISAHASGNVNPLHLPHLDGDADGVPEPLAPSMWLGTQFSALLGNKLPGPGTLYRSQTLNFHGRAEVGDTLTATISVREKRADSIVALDCRMVNQNGKLLVDGLAEVIAPTGRIETSEVELPDIVVRRCDKFERLSKRAQRWRRLRPLWSAPRTRRRSAGRCLRASAG
jgi:phosphate butyryltransferase